MGRTNSRFTWAIEPFFFRQRFANAEEISRVSNTRLGPVPKTRLDVLTVIHQREKAHWSSGRFGLAEDGVFARLQMNEQACWTIYSNHPKTEHPNSYWNMTFYSISYWIATKSSDLSKILTFFSRFHIPIENLAWIKKFYHLKTRRLSRFLPASGFWMPFAKTRQYSDGKSCDLDDYSNLDLSPVQYSDG